MPERDTDFTCLRCGFEFVDAYDAKTPRERACARCGSNSVRPTPKKKTAAKPPAPAKTAPDEPAARNTEPAARSTAPASAGSSGKSASTAG